MKKLKLSRLSLKNLSLDQAPVLGGYGPYTAQWWCHTNFCPASHNCPPVPPPPDSFQPGGCYP